MKKINILKKNTDFNRIINTKKAFKSKNYIIYLEKIKDETYYFGFSVGKKIGNAVARNKIKRQLKNIIDKKNYKNGFNCIIIVKKGILTQSFIEKEDELLKNLKKLKIIKEKNNA
ncbi:MAG: ribonuclease P protein component [Bacilli bacterium]